MSVTIIHKTGSGIPDIDSLVSGEIAVDVVTGVLYTKSNSNPPEIVEIGPSSGGGTGSSVHIGENPPADPQEGQQWMEVPASGDATMWIYDGGKWLEQPSSGGGGGGADGNIADGTQDGIVATWDSTAGDDGAGQWTPDSSLTIDSTGDATFSGAVNASKVQSPFWLRADGTQGLFIGSNVVYPANASGAIDDQISLGDSNYKFKDAYFSGTVNAPIFAGDQGQGFALVRDNAVTPQKNGTSSNNTLNLGEASFQWKQVFAVTTRSQRVIQDGSPVIDAKGLIKTLSTLRNATKDETTLEGLRDSIGNAIGGLIEEFENQIATMPAGDES